MIGSKEELQEILDSLISQIDDDAATGDFMSIAGAATLYQQEAQQASMILEILKLKAQMFEWISEYCYFRARAVAARTDGEIDMALRYESGADRLSAYLEDLNVCGCETIREAFESRGDMTLRSLTRQGMH